MNEDIFDDDDDGYPVGYLPELRERENEYIGSVWNVTWAVCFPEIYRAKLKEFLEKSKGFDEA